jgi:ATP-dependent DNA ligase
VRAPDPTRTLLAVDLPILPPVKPMLAKAVYEVPRGPGLMFEPKWDGFRCVVFRDGDEVVLGSRNDRPLTRYFPEVLDPVRAALADRCVVDGEIVVVTDDGLDFEALQQRIHPAASRINRLAGETPATFVAFDLLALGDRDLCAEPFAERRRLLEESIVPSGQVRVTPVTRDPDEAEDWFRRFEGAGFDGVMAKAGDAPYVQDARSMLKVKHQRTADAVVAGFRWHKDGQGIGSLLLGLFDDEGSLHNVGVATSFTAARRRELVDEVAPLRADALEGHPWQAWAEAQAQEGDRLMPGAPSRWNATKDLTWEPLRPERVVEVRYEHVMGGRFRHASRMLRWRDDKTPEECTYEQLEAVAPAELSAIFGVSPTPRTD